MIRFFIWATIADGCRDESLAASTPRQPGQGAGTENEDMDDLTKQDALELEVANFG